MGLGRQIFKHTIIYSMATVIGRLASFLMLPFYAYIFQAEGYGVIAMIDTSLGFLTILLTGGFQTAILRIYHEQSKANKKLVLGTGICLVWILGILIIFFPLFFSSSLSKIILGSSQYYPLICLALIAFVIDVSGQSASTIQIIKQQSLSFSIINLIRLALGLFLNIWLVVILEIGLVGIFISSLMAAIVSSLVFHIIAFREHGCEFDRNIAIHLLRFQLPLLPGEIISFLGRQAERILVRVLIGLEGMGVLEMAYKFPPLINLFITVPFQRAWRTKSIEIAEQENAPQIISKMFTRYLFLMIFFGLILGVTIKDILKLMTPPEFWSAVSIAQIEIITTIINGSITYLSFGILYYKKTGVLSFIKIILVPPKIILGFFCISLLGLQGAAYSALFIEIITLVWILFKSQSLYELPLEYWKIFFIVICAFIIFFLLNNKNYSEFDFAIYLMHNCLSPFIAFLNTTLFGEWKSGKFILLLNSRQDQIISMFLNIFFTLPFLMLFPLISRPTSANFLPKSAATTNNSSHNHLY
ncbi:MAG: oligosaccharide flippase family protein [Candidatus Competibacteraceae bacterium]|nr:oligosaccharide flippase family protein [Candidatus Competibacteraceae bacterium]